MWPPRWRSGSEGSPRDADEDVDVRRDPRLRVWVEPEGSLSGVPFAHQGECYILQSMQEVAPT